MKDEVLERIWKSREAIARRCDYDSHKLVRYFQERQKSRETEDEGTPDPTGSTDHEAG